MEVSSPEGRPPYKDPDQPVERRVEDLLSRMNLGEKIAQLGSYWAFLFFRGKDFSGEMARELLRNGIGQISRLGSATFLEPAESARVANALQKVLVENTRLGIPAIIHDESCSGYMAKGATCFPQAIGMACTWDPELVEAVGKVIREQMRSVGVHQALAPLLDVTRDPRWGRVEEAFGEDPYLVSCIGSSYIRGMQGEDLRHGVACTGKHFVGYGNSEGGMNWAPAHIPPRELREVFLFPFEAAVKEAKLASIMNSYSEIDGIPCGCSKELLTDILRGEWGFDGVVVSDYFTVYALNYYHMIARDKVEAARMALEAGLDVELPSMDCYGEPLKEAVRQGIIEEKVIDRAVARVLLMKFRLGLFENPYVEEKKTPLPFDTSKQRELSYMAARKSLVLLKNENDILPLKKDIKSLAVIGPNADSVRNMLGDYTFAANAEIMVETRAAIGGDATPIPAEVEPVESYISVKSILAGVKEKVSQKTEVYYARGCEVLGDSKDGFAEAVEAASKVDVALVFVGDKSGLVPDCTSGETRDRAEIGLPGVQEDLVMAICETGTPVVVILVNGRPFSLGKVAEKAAAILEAWLPGEEGARAVADALFGDYNPGGKLAISFPRTSGQIPVYYCHKPSGGRSHWRGDYVETSTRPLFPFGHGLSYTLFEYRDLAIRPEKTDAAGEVEISLEVDNVCDRMWMRWCNSTCAAPRPA